MPRKASTESTSTKKVKKPSTHPKWEEMIASAIIQLKDRTGSSLPALTKFLSTNFKVPEDQLRTQLKIALKRGVAKNHLLKVKGSYRLSPTERERYVSLLKKRGVIQKIPKKKASTSKTEGNATSTSHSGSAEKTAKRARSKSPKKPAVKKAKVASGDAKKMKNPKKPKAAASGDSKKMKSPKKPKAANTKEVKKSVTPKKSSVSSNTKKSTNLSKKSSTSTKKASTTKSRTKKPVAEKKTRPSAKKA